MRIRKAASRSDWRSIRELCCLTGNSGDPIPENRWALFSEIWVGPYQKLLPEWTYVAEFEGRVVGYLTGCPDTEAFERRRRWQFSFPLVRRILFGRYGWSADAKRYVKRFFHLERSPERAFAKATRERIQNGFPAHLHVNVDASVRGQRIGQKLLDRFFEDLGGKGVHVHCGAKPLRFYRRCGFAELGKLEFRPGIWVYALGIQPEPAAEAALERQGPGAELSETLLDYGSAGAVGGGSVAGAGPSAETVSGSGM